MVFNALIILGSALLSVALRSFRSAVLQKLGTLGILVTSYLVGYLLTGTVTGGVICASSWFVLPWFEILTRIRQLRLPPEKALRHKTPPSHEAFPELNDLTAEVEDEGFEFLEDVGWEWEDYQQFFRLFYKADEQTQAAICMVDQGDMAFFYLTVSSRTKDGTLWTTWNYPFSHSLKLAPELKLNRVRGENNSVFELCESHRYFLARNGVGLEQLSPVNPEEIQLEIQDELRAQIAYNINVGVLTRTEEGMVRYSWRGMFFLWVQCLRDLVRLS